MKLLAKTERSSLTLHQVHEQTKFISQYGSIYLGSNLIGGTFFALVTLLNQLEHILLIGIWYVAMLVLNTLRWMLEFEFKAHPHYEAYQLDNLLSRYILYTTLISTLWGATGLVLFSTQVSFQALHVVILSLMLIASLPLLMISRTYRYIQIAILLVPILLSLSIVGELGQSALAVSTVILGVGCGAMAQLLSKLLLEKGDLQQSLIEQTNKDTITLIPNRRYFEQSLKTEWQRAARSGESIALLMIDLDHFKLFNQLRGHDAGDAALRNIAQVLRQVAKRTSDVVARYGGDEYVVLLPSTDIEDAALLAERMRESVEALQLSHAPDQFERVLTISVGVSFCYPTPARATTESASPTGALYPAAIVSAVERALHKAKRSTRNQVVKEYCGDEEISRAAMYVSQLKAAKAI